MRVYFSLVCFILSYFKCQCISVGEWWEDANLKLSDKVSCGGFLLSGRDGEWNDLPNMSWAQGYKKTSFINEQSSQASEESSSQWIQEGNGEARSCEDEICEDRFKLTEQIVHWWLQIAEWINGYLTVLLLTYILWSKVIVKEMLLSGNSCWFSKTEMHAYMYSLCSKVPSAQEGYRPTGPSFTSIVWKHFRITYSDKKKVICDQCNKWVSYPCQSTGPMLQHLRKFHDFPGKQRWMIEMSKIRTMTMCWNKYTNPMSYLMLRSSL